MKRKIVIGNSILTIEEFKEKYKSLLDRFDFETSVEFARELDLMFLEPINFKDKLGDIGAVISFENALKQPSNPPKNYGTRNYKNQ
ncbi:hypothetical protein ACFSTE_15900 [Aquimarina hainanensis]|uniref:Uncharacterized protein n=1 Tax=Aquimarina hainanensis TaxID=1578017 RepID=A0ABW5N9T6_9FLAO